MDYPLDSNSIVNPSQESEYIQGVDSQSSASTENLAIASIASPSSFTIDESLSLNSSTLPPSVFAGIESITDNSNGSGEGTIFSSIPSGASVFPPPQANRDTFAMSPHPQLTISGNQSLSTTNTEFYPSEQVFPERSFGDSNDDNEDPQFSTSSSLTNANTLLTSDRTIAGTFEDGAFERVADHLSFDLPNNRRGNTRVDRLVSDSDWLKDVLPFLSENSEPLPTPLVPLPPKPSPRNVTSSSKGFRKVPYQAEKLLPPEFVCGICKDVLVGACILDCNCCCSTVCTSCWEDGDCNQQEFATQMDFVWVESKKCPSCHVNTDIKAYCHALDVAILRIIQDLPDSDVSVSSLKQNYFSRLSNWRKTVSDRNERYRKQKSIRDDELLARLIQEEERVFWNQSKGRSGKKTRIAKPSNKFIVFGQALLALITAVGLKHLSKR